MIKLEELYREVQEVKQLLRINSRRWQRMPKYGPGGGSSCVNYWRLWLQSPYQPDTGDFDVIVVSYDSSESESTNTITIDHDASSTDVAALLRDIADLGDGSDAENDNFTVAGGPLPLNSLQVSNKRNSGKRIKSLSVDTHTLSRAWPLCDAFVF